MPTSSGAGPKFIDAKPDPESHEYLKLSSPQLVIRQKSFSPVKGNQAKKMPKKCEALQLGFLQEMPARYKCTNVVVKHLKCRDDRDAKQLCAVEQAD